MQMWAVAITSRTIDRDRLISWDVTSVLIVDRHSVLRRHAPALIGSLDACRASVPDVKFLDKTTHWIHRETGFPTLPCPEYKNFE